MPNKGESNERRRMVVEEIKSDEVSKEEVKEHAETVEPKILDEAAKDTITTEPENKVEEKKTDVVKETSAREIKKSSLNVLWIIIPVIFLLGAILGGIVFYQRGVNYGQEGTTTPTSEPSPVPFTTSTPSASVDLTKYSISVFNGSGISGEAGKAKTLLTTAGFKVGSTANAATYDYTKTIIKAQSTVDAAFIAALSSALGKTYVVDSPQTLASSSADTIQVVIGSSKTQ